jgi:hypothetical protein
MAIIKTFGLVFCILGIIGIAAWAIPEVKAMIPNIDMFGDMPLLITSIVVALVGLFLATRGSHGRQAKEVPIYQGKNIVGYRRH